MSILNKKIERFLARRGAPDFKNHANGSQILSLGGLNYPAKLSFLNYIKTSGRKILFVVTDERSALAFEGDLKNLYGLDAATLPCAQTQFYEDVPNNLYIYAEQLKALLGDSLDGCKRSSVLIAPVRALFEKFADEKFFEDNFFELKKGEEYGYDSIKRKLSEFGYKSSVLVNDIGEFSLRGDILDVYTYAKLPVRVEFFGDSIEDVRYFDPQTQKSVESLERVRILPLYKFLLGKNNVAEFEKHCAAGARSELSAEICEKLNNSSYFEGIEYYAQFFNKNLVSLFSYFQNYVLIFDDKSQIFSKLENLNEQYRTEFEATSGSEIKLPLKTFNHNAFEEISSEAAKYTQMSFENFAANEEGIDFETNLMPNFSADIEKIASYLKEQLKNGAKINICTNFKKRLEEILNEYEIFSPLIKIKPQIQSGGEFKDILTGERTVVLTDKELFNQRQKPVISSKYTQNKQSAEYIESINDIKEGEYVVHNIHGIGRYKGLSKQEIDGFAKDYLLIEFAGTDKLYMPAEQVNLLTRYRGEGSEPRLSKMGGSAWETTKNRVKKEVEEIAHELLNLYAKREMTEGIEFEPDTNWQIEMEEGFEFIETPDQMRAIDETKTDMETSKPMDRLVCADVGFGKTEIAIRAIFKCVMSGYQACMICPTTLLSLQHFKTLQERFQPFSLRVALLSRFVSKKEQKETLLRLKNGEIDVVVGTHRLLQDDIELKNLGLLVIDEEHRFGVRHKEKLKKMRENIDILSLSATPIPRTLNMALSGLKDMSVINTPPKNRLPVRTFVGERGARAISADGHGTDNAADKYIKNAIEFEIGRDGQIFYLHNRIETIYNVQKYLETLVPSAKIMVAHGRMNENELENIMLDFSLARFDVLLCTTIIESGLDITNANTIIIDDCDRFGLAQLYQLRGRVGRSDRQAFCYCFYKGGKELSEEAFKRLNAIKEFTSLGSGYHIALRDIEIRGVGNILGSKQHGHMANVGFDTYCNLLEETVNEIKALQKNEKPRLKSVSTTIDINVTAFIPDEWVGSTEQKMLEYKRLSDVKTLSELEQTAVSLKDRFSKLPESVENLIKLIKLRLLANQNRITKILETPDSIRIYTPFKPAEWHLIKPKLKRETAALLKFQSLQSGEGILIMNKSYLDFDKMFNMLSDLMYDISSIVLELLENN